MKNLIRIKHFAIYILLCVVFVSCSEEQIQKYKEQRKQEYPNSYACRVKQCQYKLTVWGHGTDSTPVLKYKLLDNGCCEYTIPTSSGWKEQTVHGNYLIEKK